MPIWEANRRKDIMLSQRQILCRPVVAVLITVMMSISLSPAAGAETIEVLAAQFVPLQMNRDGKAIGYVTELAERVIARVRQKRDLDDVQIKILPFRRAIANLQKRPNVLFFSLSRTAKREDQYLWVGEVSPYEIFFFKLKTRTDIVSTTLLEVLRDGHRIGVAAASNTEGLLQDLGFQKGHHYVTYSHYSRGVKMMFNNRFAMMPLTSFVARANVCRLGFDGDQIEPVIQVDKLSNPLWMVFSKGTPSDLVAAFKTELAELKQQGVDREIRERYLTQQNSQPCVAVKN
jgi:polar amino acid transport system substrate-binding protein